jgi:acyl carrier protein
VKVRGYRIEVGEVEAVLQSHQGVREVAVAVREDAAGEKRLVAYVVPAAEGAARGAELLSHSRAQLPEYMLPAAWVTLDELPRLPNGKINRKALPAPDSLSAESGARYVAPQTEVERALAGIWQEVLQTSQVGVYDNFFADLGGNSLMLIQVLGKLRESLGRDVSIVELFQFPTINSLAHHLGDGGQPPDSFEEIDDQTEHRREALRRRRQLKQDRRAMLIE